MDRFLIKFDELDKSQPRVDDLHIGRSNVFFYMNEDTTYSSKRDARIKSYKQINFF